MASAWDLVSDVGLVLTKLGEWVVVVIVVALATIGTMMLGVMFFGTASFG